MYVRYEFHPLVSALIDESAQGLRNLAELLQVHSVHHTIRHDPCFGPYDYGDHNAQQLPIFWVICAPSFKLEWMLPQLRILLEHGAELNVFHESLCITPLHFVMPSRDDTESARLTIARFLVKNGGDPNLPFPTLLQYIPCQTLCNCISYLSFSAEVILCLLEIGTNPNQCDKNGLTASILAVREGHNDSAMEPTHYCKPTQEKVCFGLEICTTTIHPWNWQAHRDHIVSLNYCLTTFLHTNAPLNCSNVHCTLRAQMVHCGQLNFVLTIFPQSNVAFRYFKAHYTWQAKMSKSFLVMHIINITMLYSV
jgi:hypothetical protein